MDPNTRVVLLHVGLAVRLRASDEQHLRGLIAVRALHHHGVCVVDAHLPAVRVGVRPHEVIEGRLRERVALAIRHRAERVNPRLPLPEEALHLGAAHLAQHLDRRSSEELVDGFPILARRRRRVEHTFDVEHADLPARSPLEQDAPRVALDRHPCIFADAHDPTVRVHEHHSTERFAVEKGAIVRR
jgi:hypothetical protein